MLNNITGIILAGGRSTRMGEDKPLIPFSGKPLIEIVIGKLYPIFKDLIIVTNEDNLYRVRDFISNWAHGKHEIRIIADMIKNKGPLGGIYTGLSVSRNRYNFIVACDMPFLNPGLIKYMAGEIYNYDAVIPERRGRLEPLCAVYSKTCIKPIEKRLARDNLKIALLIRHLKARVVSEEEVSGFDSEGISFLNVNTPEQKRRLDYEPSPSLRG